MAERGKQAQYLLCYMLYAMLFLRQENGKVAAKQGKQERHSIPVIGVAFN